MTYNPNVLTRAVWHQQPMFKIKSLPNPYRLIKFFLDESPILRMCSLQYAFHSRFEGSVVLKDSKRFLRPHDVSTGNAPAETARVTHSLRFCQVGFAAQQGLLGAFALHYLSCQFLVDRRQLAGPFYDPLLKLLIQPVDFSLSLFVPGRLDNVPTPTPLCYRKLMGPHYIQDFSSSARREWISAKHREALTGDRVIE